MDIISYLPKLTISTKILLTILSPTPWYSASAVDLMGNQLHMCDPVFCDFATQLMGFSTYFNYKYSHCFVKWVGPNYLFPFQVPVDMFILGCRVELLRFAPPFWVKPNSGSKFPDYIKPHLGTFLFYPSFLLNKHIQQTIQSV